MYIFGESPLSGISSGVNVTSTANKLMGSQSAGYYDEAYNHLVAVSVGLKLPKFNVTELCLIDLPSYKSLLAMDPEELLAIGRIAANLLSGEFEFLDWIARQRLTKQFGGSREVEIKINGKNFSDWRSLVRDSFTESMPKMSSLSLKLSYPGESKKATLRGRLDLREDRWGAYPREFVQSALGNWNSENGTLVLNKILYDHYVRRELAEKYLSRPDSTIMSKIAFKLAVENILPFAPQTMKHDPTIFEALRGGRTPSLTYLNFDSAEDSSEEFLKFQVNRCLKCGAPVALALDSYSDDYNFSELKNKLRSATNFASSALAIGHGNRC